LVRRVAERCVYYRARLKRDTSSVDDFELGRLLKDGDRFLRVFDAWELDDDLVVTTGLDQRLADPKAVHPPFERVSGAVEGLFVNLLAGRRAGLKLDLEAALQVETLPDWTILLEARDVPCAAGEVDPRREKCDQENDDNHMP
jgi:hypothetical protein